MVIAREFVTKLGFSFDKTNLDKFENSIIGFKSRVALAASVIAYGFKKAIDYAQEFSNKILKNNALATFSKTAIQDLQALENVFQKFNVEPEIFQGFFEKLSIGIKEASRGVNNDFRTLVTQSQGAIRLFVNNELTTTKQAIDDIFAYIKSKSDESEKLRIAQNIFKVDIAVAQEIVNLANLTKKEFDFLIEKEKQSVEVLNEQREAARAFKTQINQLNTEWSKFSTNVAKFALPFLSSSLGGANLFIEKTKSEGISSSLSFVHAAIEDFFAGFRNEGHLDKVKRQVEEEDAYFNRKLAEMQAQNNINNAANINNTNNIEINVPLGTTEQQGTFMAEQLQRSMNSFWDEKVREVINNNPQVE